MDCRVKAIIFVNRKTIWKKAWENFGYHLHIELQTYRPNGILFRLHFCIMCDAAAIIVVLCAPLQKLQFYVFFFWSLTALYTTRFLYMSVCV